MSKTLRRVDAIPLICTIQGSGSHSTHLPPVALRVLGHVGAVHMISDTYWLPSISNIPLLCHRPKNVAQVRVSGRILLLTQIFHWHFDLATRVLLEYNSNNLNVGCSDISTPTHSMLVTALLSSHKYKIKTRFVNCAIQ